MQSIEDRADADYGSRVLAAFRKQGLSTSQWNAAAVRAMAKASRLEFLDLFKRHERLVSYPLIEIIRTGTPERLAARLVKERAEHEQMMAMVPVMFRGGF